MQKLEEDEDDSYVGADWANPNNLKNHLNGVDSKISWKGGR